MVNKDNLQSGSLEHIENLMDETETVSYEFDDHYYEFEYKTNIEWSDKMDIMMQNLTTDDVKDLEEVDEDDLNLTGMYKDLLSAQIVDSNVDKINIFLAKMPDELGEAMAEDIADTVGLFEDDSGNLKKL